MNVYLLREADRDLLLDTGIAIHRDQILTALAELGIGGRPLSILNLRPGELDSVCNLAAIARSFPVDSYLCYHSEGIFWGDLDPAAPFDPEHDAMAAPPGLVDTGGMLEVEIGSGDRRLEVLAPALRLLYTQWLYDSDSKTLFTSDSFSWGVSPSSEPESWTTRDMENLITEEQVRDHLLSARYWWLTGADLSEIRANLNGVFADREVNRIAPAYGCIIEGADEVQRQYELLSTVLAQMDRTCGVSLNGGMKR
jgi:hypothetical protein